MGYSRRRLFVGILCILGGMLVSSFMSDRAAAATLTCRSDPVVLTLNGAIDLGANINDNLSDVQQVVYVLHAPAGDPMLLALNTDGLMGLKEKFIYYADNRPGVYDAYTTVYTGQKGVSVTATMTVVGLLNLGLPTASGYSGQALHTHVGSLL